MPRQYVVLRGGFGNRLFQLAAALTVGTPQSMRSIDRGPAQSRGALLDQLAFGLVRGASTGDRLRLGILDSPPGVVGRVVNRSTWPLRRDVGRRAYRQDSRELQAAFEPMPEFGKPPLLLDGHFQHPDWYSPSLITVLDRLAAAEPHSSGSTVGDDSAVLCVRSGTDYTELGWRLGVDYYRSAIEAVDASHFYVVSDEPGRASEMLSAVSTRGRKFELIAPDPVRHFWLHAQAPAVIMANSSFSWWATMLGDELHRRREQRRVVVAPAGWVRGAGGCLVQQGWCAIASE